VEGAGPADRWARAVSIHAATSPRFGFWADRSGSTRVCLGVSWLRAKQRSRSALCRLQASGVVRPACPSRGVPLRRRAHTRARGLWRLWVTARLAFALGCSGFEQAGEFYARNTQQAFATRTLTQGQIAQARAPPVPSTRDCILAPGVVCLPPWLDAHLVAPISKHRHPRGEAGRYQIAQIIKAVGEIASFPVPQSAKDY